MRTAPRSRPSAATPCRAARRPGRSCGRACCAGRAAGGAGARGRGAAAGARPRAIVWRRAAASSVSAISRNCCASSRPPRARADPRVDVVRGADPHARPLLEQRAPGRSRRGRARRSPGRTTARAPRRGAATGRTTSSRRAAPGPGELEEGDRARVHQPRSSGARPLTDGLPATTNRHGTDVQGSAGVGDADPGRARRLRARARRPARPRAGAARPGRTGRCR